MNNMLSGFIKWYVFWMCLFLAISFTLEKINTWKNPPDFVCVSVYHIMSDWRGNDLIPGCYKWQEMDKDTAMETGASGIWLLKMVRKVRP